MRSSFLLLLSALILGLSAWVIHHFDAPIRHLERELDVLGSSPSYRPSPASTFADRLRGELSQAYEQLEPLLEDGQNPAAVYALVEGRETPDDLQVVRDYVAQAGPFLDRVEHVLTRPEIQAAMRKGERLAWDIPRLLQTRSEISVICAAGLLDAIDGQGQRACERFAVAMDFAYAVDDRTLISGVIRAALEGSVHGCAMRSLEHALVDSSALREVLEPRLARAFDEEYRVDVVHREIQLVTELAQDLESLDGTSELQLLESLLELKQLATFAGLPSTFYLKHRQDLVKGDELVMGGAAMQSLQQHLPQGELLRILLALHVYREMHGQWPDDLRALASLFPEGLPVDPHSGSLFPYEPHDKEAWVGPTALAKEDYPDWDRAADLGLARVLR